MGCSDPNILPFGSVPNTFASLLQEAEMVSTFLLMYATAVVFSSFNNTVVWFHFCRKFQAQKGSFQFKGIYVEFIFHKIPSFSNFCYLICASPAFQTCIRKNCKIKSRKFDGCKSIENVSYPSLSFICCFL